MFGGSPNSHPSQKISQKFRSAPLRCPDNRDECSCICCCSNCCCCCSFHWCNSCSSWEMLQRLSNARLTPRKRFPRFSPQAQKWWMSLQNNKNKQFKKHPKKITHQLVSEGSSAPKSSKIQVSPCLFSWSICSCSSCCSKYLRSIVGGTTASGGTIKPPGGNGARGLGSQVAAGKCITTCSQEQFWT